MPFIRAICTAEVFEQLALPSSLVEDAKLNPLNQSLVFDLASRSALIPHPFHYSDYPDRALSFYVAGRYFNVGELVQSSEGPDRAVIYFDNAASPEVRLSTTSLLQQAVAVFRNEPLGAIPVVERIAWR
jgi:hypothetical protein